MDINLENYNIDTDELTKKLKIAKKEKNLPKVLIVVHIAGHPCDLKSIYKLSKIYKFKIIQELIDLTFKSNSKSKTKIVAITHLSNVTGTIVPVKEIIDIFKDHYKNPVTHFHRWRLFYIACSEFFSIHEGDEWFVSHYLLSPK